MKKLLLILMVGSLFSQLRIALDIEGEYTEASNGIINYYDVKEGLSIGYDHIVKKIVLDNYSQSTNDDYNLSVGWGLDYKHKIEVEGADIDLSFLSPYLLIKFNVFDFIISNRIGRGAIYKVYFNDEINEMHSELEINYSVKPFGFFNTSIGFSIPFIDTKSLDFSVGYVRNYFRFEMSSDEPTPTYPIKRFATYSNSEYSAFTIALGVPIR